MTRATYASSRADSNTSAAPTVCFAREQGIRAVELLVLQRPSTGAKHAMEEVVLKRFLGTMDLGWHAAVQPDGEIDQVLPC